MSAIYGSSTVEESPTNKHDSMSHKSLRRKIFARVLIEYPNGKSDYEIMQDESPKDVISALVRVS